MTGGGDAELKIWKLDFKSTAAGVDTTNDKDITKFVTKEPKDKKGKLDTVKEEESDDEERKEKVEEDDNSVLSIKVRYHFSKVQLISK